MSRKNGADQQVVFTTFAVVGLVVGVVLDDEFDSLSKPTPPTVLAFSESCRIFELASWTNLSF